MKRRFDAVASGCGRRTLEEEGWKGREGMLRRKTFFRDAQCRVRRRGEYWLSTTAYTPVGVTPFMVPSMRKLLLKSRLCQFGMVASDVAGLPSQRLLLSETHSARCSRWSVARQAVVSPIAYQTERHECGLRNRSSADFAPNTSSRGCNVCAG